MKKEQTIAQFLNVKEFPFEIKDKNGKQLYYENSDLFWIKKNFDSNNNEIYYEDSNAFWFKKEFNLNKNVIYFENSSGTIIDKRPKKELTMQEIADKLQSILEDLNKIK